ncbi:TetR family transcriptional regulator [Altererythrobacter salegens]|uniref:TetR family transcriptional regulator n=1 Tax=Croceibacterium salegens TaxID=1737568 RepID=A0A6I4SVL1_9SPHN|nr:TetR/AcrR family transcriptional regulator [Croceibacterium salegens]MXO59991.1 TetR family transcriptional regulator [Croceibacterium salegens]
MVISSLTSSTKSSPSLREAQAALTRNRILKAAASLLAADGDPKTMTFKAVAEAAAITEMTVYRHFPNRDALLKGVWEYLNAQMDPRIGMPRTVEEMLGQHQQLFAGFDRLSAQIIAAIGTPQGREMRAALNDDRQEAFLAIVAEVAPQLDTSHSRKIAALIQLLHSAYAWASLREQWELSGDEAAEATRWLLDLILERIKEPNP